MAKVLEREMAQPGRRRLSPEARTEQLLDCARALVEEGGVEACTSAAIADRGSVTVQLVHRYLGTRPELLRALYRREEDRFTRALRSELERAEDFEAVVRAFVTANFAQLPGSTALGRLRGAPEVREVVAELERRDRGAARALLAHHLAKAFPVPEDTVDLVLQLGSAASLGAAGLSEHRAEARSGDIETTVRFILAGTRAVAHASREAD